MDLESLIQDLATYIDNQGRAMRRAGVRMDLESLIQDVTAAIDDRVRAMEDDY